jgi:PAS domain S-box-containing protein
VAFLDRTLRTARSDHHSRWHPRLPHFRRDRVSYRAQRALALLSRRPVILHEPWRLLAGAIIVLLPAPILALFSPALPVTTPGVVLLVAVAFATYLADWAGGITSLVLASLALDVLFVGDRSNLSVPKDVAEGLGFGATLASGLVVIALIERVKQRSIEDRRAAIIARSTASVLASLRAAATNAPGDEAGRRKVFEGVLRALVGMHGAHAGVLFLAGDNDATLTLAARYGFGTASAERDEQPAFVAGFAGLVAQELRTLAIEDLARDPRVDKAALQDTALRSVLGMPVIGSDGALRGVAVIGLLARHRFTPVEIAKFEALVEQVAPIIEAASASAERETQLRRARAEQQRLAHVLTALPEAVVLAAPPDGRILAANDAATALFGPLRDADLRERLIGHENALSGAESLPIDEVLRTGEVIKGVELLALGPGGTTTPVLASAAPIREPNGEIAAVVAVFRNITALKEAARVKDEFVSVVSHELRSPLTPIRGFVQLVAKELAKEGGHDHHVRRLQAIAGHVDRMTRLVDDLLDVSRLRAGGLEIRRAPADVVAICREVLQSRIPTAPEHHLNLVAPETGVVGCWDADRLHQVIDNLVGNAIKYTPAGGRITVTVEADDSAHEAIVRVSDTGPGIPVEDRERIFTAFYRVENSGRGGAGGLGLGLYICHELVAAHGGRISVSDAAGGGAEFTVRLPREVHCTASA